MTKLVGVFGASGFGREVMPLVRAANHDCKLVFVDDNPPANQLNGYPVMTFNDFLEHEFPNKSVTIAIADAAIRAKLTDKCALANIAIMSVVASNVVAMDSVSIGEGAIICPFSTITSNVTIGKSFHSNIYSYVAHDCVIGDFVTFAPSVHCNGNVHIEDYAYIGTGAILKQGTPDKPLVIGRGAVVGMGAVVTKSVDAGAIVVGNPAKPLEKRS
jgi:sugar O-acyltransferase (sialic acid O-acetyltransferase NeuD family)